MTKIKNDILKHNRKENRIYPFPIEIKVPDNNFYIMLAIGFLTFISIGFLDGIWDTTYITIVAAFGVSYFLLLLFYLKFRFKRVIELKNSGIYKNLYFRRNRFIPWNSIGRAKIFEHPSRPALLGFLYDNQDKKPEPDFKIPLYAISLDIERLLVTLKQAIDESKP